MKEFVKPLRKHLEYLQQATLWVAMNGLSNPDDAGAAAVEYQRMFAHVALAHVWARQAKVAQERLAAGGDKSFYEGKLATARFFMQRILPMNVGLLSSLTGGSKSLMAAEI